MPLDGGAATPLVLTGLKFRFRGRLLVDVCALPGTANAIPKNRAAQIAVRTASLPS
jgi:hypothetical protein